jgi:hypothetical protein
MDHSPRPNPPIAFRLGDVVRLRRSHPCGGSAWLVDRLGADIGLRCTSCARRVLLARSQVERRLAGFEARGDETLNTALAPIAGDQAP